MTANHLADPKDQSPLLKTPGGGWPTRHLLSPETGRMLRAARRRQGRSAYAVARQVGISEGHLLRLERAERAPSKPVARALWVALDLTMDEAEALIAESVGGVGRGR